jgi:hypothetical protein
MRHQGAVGEARVNYWISLFVMMTFFSVLALDIYVPTVNLCLMLLARWIVLYGMPDTFTRERTA